MLFLLGTHIVGCAEREVDGEALAPMAFDIADRGYSFCVVSSTKSSATSRMSDLYDLRLVGIECFHYDICVSFSQPKPYMGPRQCALFSTQGATNFFSLPLTLFRVDVRPHPKGCSEELLFVSFLFCMSYL